MSSYGWIVTVDNVTPSKTPLHRTELRSRVGWTGPRDADDALDARLKAGAGIEWRTGIYDDGRMLWSYYGRLVLDAAAPDDAAAQWQANGDGDAWSAPLDHMGGPDAGDSEIQHKNPLTGKWESVVG